MLAEVLCGFVSNGWTSLYGRHTWSIWRERITRRKKHWRRMQRLMVARRPKLLALINIFTVSCVTSCVLVPTRLQHIFGAQNTTRSITDFLLISAVSHVTCRLYIHSIISVSAFCTLYKWGAWGKKGIGRVRPFCSKPAENEMCHLINMPVWSIRHSTVMSLWWN